MDYGLTNRGNFISVHIADIHFGAMDPLTEYNILKEQFLYPISLFPRIDLISLDGDLTDRKFLANSDAIRYAIQFVDDVINIARVKGSTVILLKGTDSHSAGQIKLFYHYLEDPTIDIRIIETIKFEYVKNAKILCIPELYGVDESIYHYFFHECGWYDLALCHGTYDGSVYGNNVGAGRLLTKEDFIYCKGLCIAGHVHKPGCFNGFFYYTGCPIRYKFGEEEAKGYLISIQDLDTGIHSVEFEEIKSFRYDTIFIDQLISEDPKIIIDYINNLRVNQNIDFIKIKFRYPINGSNKTIINNYYRNNPNTFIEFLELNEIEKQKAEESFRNDNQYPYLLDNNLSDMDKFIRFICDSEGEGFITATQLIEFLNEKVQ